MNSENTPLRTAAPQDYLRESGTCKDCGSPVDRFLGNAQLVAARPEAEAWDWWAACSNPICKNSYGAGYFQTQLDWVK